MEPRWRKGGEGDREGGREERRYEEYVREERKERVLGHHRWR